MKLKITKLIPIKLHCCKCNSVIKINAFSNIEEENIRCNKCGAKITLSRRFLKVYNVSVNIIIIVVGLIFYLSKDFLQDKFYLINMCSKNRIGTIFSGLLLLLLELLGIFIVHKFLLLLYILLKKDKKV